MPGGFKQRDALSERGRLRIVTEEFDAGAIGDANGERRLDGKERGRIDQARVGVGFIKGRGDLMHAIGILDRQCEGGDRLD